MGIRNIIQLKDDETVIGEQIQTRGNDEEYPTFLLDDGRLFSVHKDRVKGVVDEVS